MCNNCNDNILTPIVPCINCEDDSNKCGFTMDAECVFYNFNKLKEPSLLVNIGYPSNTNLKLILERIDELLGVTAPTILADNGLTKISDTIELGGSLVKNTTIDFNSYNFSLLGSGLRFQSFPNTLDNSLSVTPLNFLYTDSQGYLKSASIDYILNDIIETPLVATDSTSINFTTSGDLNHQITAEINLAIGSPFSLTSGLDLTVLNGLFIEDSTLKLGGILVEDTTLEGSYKFNFVNTSVHIGSDSITRASSAQLSIIPRATGTDDILNIRSYTDPYKNYFNISHGGIINIGYFNGGATIGDNTPGLRIYNGVVDGTKYVINFERLNGTLSSGFKAYHIAAINPNPLLLDDIGNTGNNTYFDSGIKLVTQHQNVATGYRGIGIRLAGNFQSTSDSSLGQVVNTSIEFSTVKRDSVNLLLTGNGSFNDTSDNLNPKKLQSLLISPIFDKVDSGSTALIAVQNTDIHINTAYGESPGGYTVIGYHYDPRIVGSIGLGIDEQAIRTERGRVVFGNSVNNSYVQFPNYTQANRNTLSTGWGASQKGSQIFVTDGDNPNTMQYWNGSAWIVM